VVRDAKVLSQEVSSSVHLHSDYGGVVPEIASRFHTEYIYPVVRKAIDDAGVKKGEIELVAVTSGPGLPGSLLVGLSFAKAVSLALGVPIIGVNHLKAHMISCFIRPLFEIDDKFPFVGMVASGGHTGLYRCDGLDKWESIGRTRDDAVGEAFDKVAKIMGLGYPGGPRVEKRANRYKGTSPIDFPRAMLKGDKGLDFSFSGIKTAVLYYWKGCDKSESEIDRICYSFQKAVTEIIVEKLRRAMVFSGCRRLAVGGGVVENAAIRSGIEDMCEKNGYIFFLPSRKLCGDNAVMVAALGEALFLRGVRSDLTLNVSAVMN
ncbi:MAG: tRNA (adenosine(37)-N6)-threonylcarbamoyltransferase complex transferase subunit TsaD, partial [Candidatus Omnitrophica bacterium]|nr:tRNA (adenosine(37)-N6)-threonylcarbamoyltransferase complex transferase subunit TsaD [Candidatus Omnitrophota bacterium]